MEGIGKPRLCQTFILVAGVAPGPGLRGLISRKNAIVKIVKQCFVGALLEMLTPTSPAFNDHIDTAGCCGRCQDRRAMCGIAGIIELRRLRPVPSHSLLRMARSLRHRGPKTATTEPVSL